MPGKISIRRRRIIHRARQRGLLELDILLGSWAAQHVPLLASRALSDVELLLDAPSPDALAWALGSAAPKVFETDVLAAVRKHARSTG